MFTMWTVGSNPTLSVESRGDPELERRGGRTKATRNEGTEDIAGPAWSCPDLLSSPFQSFHHSFGAVAQLGERQNRNLEVGGSIPLCSTRKAGRQSVSSPSRFTGLVRLRSC